MDMTSISDVHDVASPRKETAETPPVSTSTSSSSSKSIFQGALLSIQSSRSGKGGKDGSQRGRRRSRLGRGSDASPGGAASPLRSKSPHSSSSRLSKMFNGSYHSLPPVSTYDEEDNNNIGKADKKKSRSKKAEANNKKDGGAGGTKEKRSSSLTALLRIKRKKRLEQNEDKVQDNDDSSSLARSVSPPRSQELSTEDTASRWPANPRPTSQRSLTVDSARTHRRRSMEPNAVPESPRPRRSTSPHPRPRGSSSNSASPRVGKRKPDSSSPPEQQQRISERKSDSSGRKERKSESSRSERKLDASLRSERQSASTRSERKIDASLTNERKSASTRSERKIDAAIRNERKSESSRSERKIDAALRNERKSESSRSERKIDSALQKERKCESRRSERKLDSSMKGDSQRSERKSDSQRSERKSDRRKKGSGSSKKKVSSKKKKEDAETKPKAKRMSRSLSTDLNVVEEGEKEGFSTQPKRKSRSLSAEVQIHDDADADDETVDGDENNQVAKSERLPAPPADEASNGKSWRSRQARSESPNVKTTKLSQLVQERISRSSHADASEVKEDRGRSISPGTRKKRFGKKIAKKFEMVSFLTPSGKKSKAKHRSSSPEKQAKKDKNQSKSPWKLKDKIRRSKSPGKHKKRVSDKEESKGQLENAPADGNATMAGTAGVEAMARSPKSVRSLEEQSQESRSVEEYDESTVGVFVSPGRKSVKGKVSLEEFRSSTVGVTVSPGRNSTKVTASPRVKKKSIVVTTEQNMHRQGWKMPLRADPTAAAPQIPQRRESSADNHNVGSGILKTSYSNRGDSRESFGVDGIGGAPTTPNSGGRKQKKLLSPVPDDEEAKISASNEESQDSWEQEGNNFSMRSIDSHGSAGYKFSKRSSRSVASYNTDATPDGHSEWSMDSTAVTPVIGNQRKQLSNEGDKRASIVPTPNLIPRSKGSSHSVKSGKMKEPQSPPRATATSEERFVQSTPVSPGAGQKIKFNPRGKRPKTAVPVRSNSVPAVGTSSGSSNPNFSPNQETHHRAILERENSTRALPAPPIRQNSFEQGEFSATDSSDEFGGEEFATEDLAGHDDLPYMESVNEDEAVTHPSTTSGPGNAQRRPSLDDVLDNVSMVDSADNKSVFSGTSYGSMTLGGGESLSSDDTFRNRTLSKQRLGRSASPDSKIMVYRNRKKEGTSSILKQPDEPPADHNTNNRKYSMVSLAPQPTITLTDYVGRIQDTGQRGGSYSRRSRSHSPGAHLGGL